MHTECGLIDLCVSKDGRHGTVKHVYQCPKSGNTMVVVVMDDGAIVECGVVFATCHKHAAKKPS